MLLPVCLLFCLSGLTLSTNVKDTQAVTLTAAPSVYQDILTREVAVNCSLPRGNITEFAQVISLILSKADPGNDNTFSEIASVTAYSHDRPDVRNASMGGQASGHVAPNSDAFLAMQWMSPNSSVSGRYKCEAFGVDRLGHPRTSAAEIVIVETPVDVSAALTKVTELYTAIDQLNQWKDISETVLAGCNGGHSALLPPNNGSYYYMTGPAKLSLSQGQEVCRRYSGYVAEVNSQGEYQYLRSYVSSKLGSTGNVMLGATDAVSEGSWVYARSGGPVTYVDWGHSFSGSSSYNCMFLTNQNHVWRMEDLSCGPSSSYVMCEIPLTV